VWSGFNVLVAAAIRLIIGSSTVAVNGNAGLDQSWAVPANTTSGAGLQPLSCGERLARAISLPFCFIARQFKRQTVTYRTADTRICACGNENRPMVVVAVEAEFL